jgi:hypothetical protein
MQADGESVSRLSRCRRTCVALSLALACVLVLVNSAGANVFGRDARVFAPAATLPARAVGMLTVADRQVGSAFLVGECHAMTAMHSVLLAQHAAPSADGAAPLLMFHGEPDPVVPGLFHAQTAARLSLAGQYHPGTPRGMAGDWAVLQLADCVGRRTGFLDAMRPDADQPLPHGDLMTIGYPAARHGRDGVAVEQGCHARERGPVVGLVGLDCAFERGMSGGPVLERSADGQWRVVGIMQLRVKPVDTVLPAYSSRHRNQMVHVIAFFRALQQFLGGQGRP